MSVRAGNVATTEKGGSPKEQCLGYMRDAVELPIQVRLLFPELSQQSCVVMQQQNLSSFSATNQHFLLEGFGYTLQLLFYNVQQRQFGATPEARNR